MAGLFGQEIAFAAGPAWQPHGEISAAMPESCMHAMGKQPAKTPCKGLTLDCIAAMGCVVPLLVVEGPWMSLSFFIPDGLLVSTSPPRLIGRSPPPEPQPPTPLI